MREELRTAFRRIEFLMKTMEPPLLDGVDTVICWLSRKIMPLYHNPHKMCEYQADASDALSGCLDEKTLLYRLKELIQPKHVRASENVPMFTHDYPPPEVRVLSLTIRSTKHTMLLGTNADFIFQFHKLTEDDLAPRWYEPETRPKKHKASATLTKDLEKKKKAASSAADEENEMLGTAIPTRW